MIELYPIGAQAESWNGLLDVAEIIPTGWVLAGGQMVFVHLLQRDFPRPRPTADIDTVIDVRGQPGKPVQRFVQALKSAGFTALQGDPSGNLHRWVRGAASIDILVPRGLAEGLSDGRNPAGGQVTIIATAGGQFLLDHSRPTEISVNGRQATIPLPEILAAAYGKASALINVGDTSGLRDMDDLLSLISVMTSEELSGISTLRPHEKRRLRSGLLRSQRARRPLLTDPQIRSSLHAALSFTASA